MFLFFFYLYAGLGARMMDFPEDPSIILRQYLYTPRTSHPKCRFCGSVTSFGKDTCLDHVQKREYILSLDLDANRPRILPGIVSDLFGVTRTVDDLVSEWDTDSTAGDVPWALMAMWEADLVFMFIENSVLRVSLTPKGERVFL